MKLADGIAVTSDLAQAARSTNAILLVVPAQEVRAVALALNDVAPSGTPIIACAKGIERGTDRFMTEVIAECAQTALPAILSGPSFAADVARGLPTAVTLAAKDLGLRSASRRRSAPARSGPITRPTCAAWRSAAPRRTCWPSPPESPRAAASAPARSPR